VIKVNKNHKAHSKDQYSIESVGVLTAYVSPLNHS